MANRLILEARRRLTRIAYAPMLALIPGALAIAGDAAAEARWITDPHAMVADAALGTSDWLDADTGAPDWRPAVLLGDDSTRGKLVASPLPRMGFQRVSSGRLVRTNGVDTEDFPARSITIPEHSEAILLLDAGREIPEDGGG